MLYIRQTINIRNFIYKEIIPVHEILKYKCINFNQLLHQINNIHEKV
jgi:hypothetical protein